MKLEKKQAAYGVVLGLAAMGFVIDRLFFTPAGAEAATAPTVTEKTAPDSSSTPTASPAPSVPLTIPAGWLAERLKSASAGSDQEFRDVFAAPACWRPVPKVALAAVAPKPPLFGEQFRRDHHLGGVVIDGRNGRAVVDGQLISVGGSIDGFRLVELTRKAARFVRADEQVLLTLSDPASISPR